MLLISPVLIYSQNNDATVTKEISKTIDLDKARKTSKKNLLIPSPVEMILQGKSLKIQVELATVRDILKYKYDQSNKILNAIYLGRELAMVSLGMDNMDDRILGMHFIKIREGLLALEVPLNYFNMFEGIRFQFENRSISRIELIEKIDRGFTSFASRLEEEQRENLLSRILQGSSWVQAQNLLAKAIKKRNEYQHAKVLLDQPEVTGYIIENLEAYKKKGKSIATINSLIKSMGRYQEATKPAQLGSKEVEIVIQETQKFLTLF